MLTRAVLLASMLVACGSQPDAARDSSGQPRSRPPARVHDPCPPLSVPSEVPRPPSVSGARAEPIVASADRWLREVEPQACPHSVRSILVETSYAMLTVRVGSDRDAQDVELRAHLECDWRVSPCGARASDWAIDAEGDAWLSMRRVDRGAAWLRAHPEILLVSEASLGLGIWRRRRVLRVNDTIVCVSNEDSMQRPVCWADPRPARHLWAWDFEWPRLPRPNADGDEHDYDRVRGFVALGPFGSTIDVWAVRFPEAEWVSLPSQPAPDASSDLRPLWFPSRERRGRAQRLPTRGWQPIPQVDAPDLGALDELSTIVIGGDDMTAMDLVTDAALAVCVRRQDRWACAPTVAVDAFAFHSDSHEHAYTMPSTTGPTWIVLQRSTWEDGGSGEGSGAGGDQFLELYRDEGARLTPVVSIQIGHMTWETVRLRSGYSRSVRRHFHTHGPAGADCLRIDAPTAHAGWADGSFATTRPAGGAARMGSLRDEAAPDIVPFTPFPTSHRVGGEGSDDDAIEPRGDFVDLRGIWRIEPDRLVRVSRDPTARCGD